MKMRIDIDANIFYQGMKDINKYHMNKTLRIKNDVWAVSGFQEVTMLIL